LENRFIRADAFPSTGVSLNIDRASYSNIRRFIRQRSPVPADAVRIEEMLNYFNLDYQQPDSGQVFRIHTRLTDCPWNAQNKLFFVQVNARTLNLDTLPPAHFTFLIDVSASMDMPNRLPLLQSAFRMLVNNLRDKDSVAIVTYGGVTDILLNTISGSRKDTIRQVIDSLVAGGATPGESGVKLAYSVARRHFIPGGNNRVILATDGDFNVGMKTEEELEALIAKESERGIYLTCLGVGMGNYKDSKIQSLAKRGNGNFAYLDGFQEAEKVLFKEFAQTLYSVADDAALSAQFNSDQVEEYRLIGFDNKLGALRDSTTRLQGGEIGTGQSALVLFELKMRPAFRHSDTLARIRLQYRLPNDTIVSSFYAQSLSDWQSIDRVDTAYRFAAALTWFGSLLRHSGFVPENSWEALLDLARGAISNSDAYQQEFFQLVQAADLIYHPKKNKKGRKRVASSE
jgi:Ca-activated chloride channel family protein